MVDPATVEALAVGDLDGDGQDELIADRGAATFALFNNSDWQNVAPGSIRMVNRRPRRQRPA